MLLVLGPSLLKNQSPIPEKGFAKIVPDCRVIAASLA